MMTEDGAAPPPALTTDTPDCASTSLALARARGSGGIVRAGVGPGEASDRAPPASGPALAGLSIGTKACGSPPRGSLATAT
jgi:hypothetical protein